jgi:hypothetical protein
MTLGRLMDAAAPSDEIALTNTMITTGLMWRCPCGATNAHDEDSDACSLCGADRLWAKDQTPPRYDYGELLADLRYALKEWFDDRPRARRPAAVSFRVTTVYDDGPAWATDGATAYFTDSSAGLAYPHDFDRSVVADSLAEVSEFDRPQTGDTLRVAIPVI